MPQAPKRAVGWAARGSILSSRIWPSPHAAHALLGQASTGGRRLPRTSHSSPSLAHHSHRCADNAT
eukprot:12330203-Alexandrium_andersonii.AAC.1